MMNTFRGSLHRLSRRLWWRICLGEALGWGFYFGLVATILALLSKFLVMPGVTIQNLLLLPCLGLLSGVMIGLWKRPDLVHTAIFLDRSLGLGDRLPTVWECLDKGEINQMEQVLIETSGHLLREIPPKVIYHGFDTGRIFRWVGIYLVLIILVFIPSYTSPAVLAREKFNRILREESAKLQNTAQDIRQGPELDTLTQELLTEMDRLAESIVEKNRSNEAIIHEIQQLTQKVEDNLRQIESSEELIQSISIAAGQLPEMTVRDPPHRQRLLRYLEDKIRQGAISLSALTQLRTVLEEALAKVTSDDQLTQYLQETLDKLNLPAGEAGAKDSPITVPLERFFQVVANKNRDILNRLLARLKATEQEMMSGRPADLQAHASVKPAISVNHEGPDFSQASNQPTMRTTHPTIGRSVADPFLPSDIKTSEVTRPACPSEAAGRLLDIEKVLQSRATALQKPGWPAAYDLIIKEYFSRMELPR